MLDAWVIKKIQEQEQERKEQAERLRPYLRLPLHPPNVTERPEREDTPERGHTEIDSVVETLF